MLVVRGRRPDLGPRRDDLGHPNESDYLRDTFGQSADSDDSRHVGGLIEVSGTEDDLRSLAGVVADEVADEASARRRADLKATFDRIGAAMGDR